jgi:hypothetical protein
MMLLASTEMQNPPFIKGGRMVQGVRHSAGRVVAVLVVHDEVHGDNHDDDDGQYHELFWHKFRAPPFHGYCQQKTTFDVRSMWSPPGRRASPFGAHQHATVEAHHYTITRTPPISAPRILRYVHTHVSPGLSRIWKRKPPV